jgi:hypothetical protein
LAAYPFLPESATFNEFSKKVANIIPEITNFEKYFPQYFQITKEAFLDYAFNAYLETKSNSRELNTSANFASIFLLDPPSARRLQFDKIIIFSQDISNVSHFFTSFSGTKNVHYITLKSNISQEFTEQYRTFTGKILDATAIRSITKNLPIEQIFQNQCNQYTFLKKIHDTRNNENSHFGPFEYATPEIQNYSLPVTAIERAYAEPEEIWYRHILKNDRQKLLFEKSKFEGTLTHDFLHYPDYSFPSFEKLQQHIATRQKHFQEIFSNILSQTTLRESIESSGEKALIIAKKLTTFENFPFIISEFDLQTSTAISDEIFMPLHGRIDCVLSQYVFRKTFHKDNAQNGVLIIDFKTGSTSQNDLQKLAKNFTNLPSSLTGLQLVLYGLMLRTLGYKNIQLLILNGDPYDSAEPIHLETIIASENFKFIQKYLKISQIDGIFGYSLPCPFGKPSFSPPIATTSPNSNAIQMKRKQLFL